MIKRYWRLVCPAGWVLTIYFGATIPIKAEEIPEPPFSVGVTYDTIPASPLKNPQNSFQQEEKVSVEKWGGRVAFTSRLGPRSSLVNGINYENISVGVSGLPQEDGTVVLGSRNLELQSIAYQFRLTTLLQERWTLATYLQPGLFSDFKGSVNRDDGKVNVGGLFSRRFDQGWALHLGLAYANTFGKSRLFPVFGFSWNQPRDRLNVTLPINAEYVHIFSNHWELGGEYKVTGGLYHLHEGEGALLENKSLSYSIGTIGPLIRIPLSPRVTFTGITGTTIFSRWKFFDGSTEISSNDVKNGFFIKTGLKINL